MKLKIAEILPGVVIDISDPNHAGRVKATVPTLFDSSVMNKDGLPWIYPANMGGYQCFSSMSVGSKIWVLIQENNYNEFWYVPMFEIHSDTIDIISGSEDDYAASDVLISRQAGDNSVYMYYTPSKGIYMQVGEKTSINIDTENHVILTADKTKVKVESNTVYIGNEDEDFEPAVMGDKLKKFCDDLCTQLGALSNAAKVDPKNAPLAAAFTTAKMKLSQETNFLAKHTKVN